PAAAHGGRGQRARKCFLQRRPGHAAGQLGQRMTQVDLGFQAGPEQVIGTDRRVLGGRRAAAHRVSESARNRGGDYPFPANSTRPLGATGRMAAGYEGFFRADYLKHAYDLSDEAVCERWLENPYWQFFTGEEFFQTRLPCDPSSLVRWHKRLGE